MADEPTRTNGATDDVTIKSEPAGARAEPETRPLPKKAKRQVRKLTKQLDAARATEARRLRQSAKAHQKVDKRERQAARATAGVAAIEGRIRELTDGEAAQRPAPAASPMPPKPPRPARRTAAPASNPKPGAPRKPAPSPKPSTTA